ncbi:Hpt domain-containing protein [Ruficoccus amylovorans]|uniref:Hpt domain-containing protein n=1 Tax=Ruficoccus amylovorans TaxID=1804625 RepID=A0A842HKF4_9BACT|nr:Hpt domain-containing protein [Ruficoccus amylovorans]MBC2596428.1 Hpt domain-containing protein [Ruficoccus amylovorans]
MSDQLIAQESALFSLSPELELLDQEQIDLLTEASESDPAFMREIVDTFRGESGSKLEQIATSAAAHDPSALRPGIHFIAGSAANTGLLRLSELCRRIEEQIDGGVFTAYDAVPALVRFEHDRALEAIERKIG